MGQHWHHCHLYHCCHQKHHPNCCQLQQCKGCATVIIFPKVLRTLLQAICPERDVKCDDLSCLNNCTWGSPLRTLPSLSPSSLLPSIKSSHTSVAFCNTKVVQQCTCRNNCICTFWFAMEGTVPLKATRLVFL